MTKKKSKPEGIVQLIEAVIDKQTQPPLSKEDYGFVLGELEERIKGRLESLKEEEGDEWYEKHVMGWK